MSKLRATLEALASTAPEDVDPEDADTHFENFSSAKRSKSGFTASNAKGGSVSGSAGDDAPPAKRSALRARAAAADVASDPRYAGVVVDAKRALKQYTAAEDEEDEQSDSGDASMDDDDAGGSEEDDEEDEEEEDDESDEEGDYDDQESDEDEESGSSGEDDGAMDDADGGLVYRAPRTRHTGDVGADTDRELAALAAADTAALARYEREGAEEGAKGSAVKAQVSIYEALLEARIKLQKPLQSSHRLPRGATAAAFQASAPEARSANTEARAELSSLLVDLLQLRASLVTAYPDAAASVEGEALAELQAVPKLTGVKRKRSEEDNDDEGEDEREQVEPLNSEELWPVVERGWSMLRPWREGTIDRWGRKLAYAAGLSAKKAVKLKVMGADISKQVEDVLADRERVLARTRLRRAAVGRVLGEAGTPQAAAQAGADTEAAAEAGAVDDETYDDSELYSALLKEYVSSAGASGAGGGMSSGKAGYKHTHRSDVDRKASKGRRMR